MFLNEGFFGPYNKMIIKLYSYKNLNSNFRKKVNDLVRDMKDKGYTPIVYQNIITSANNYEKIKKKFYNHSNIFGNEEKYFYYKLEKGENIFYMLEYSSKEKVSDLEKDARLDEIYLLFLDSIDNDIVTKGIMLKKTDFNEK